MFLETFGIAIIINYIGKSIVANETYKQQNIVNNTNRLLYNIKSDIDLVRTCTDEAMFEHVDSTLSSIIKHCAKYEQILDMVDDKVSDITTDIERRIQLYKSYCLTKVSTLEQQRNRHLGYQKMLWNRRSRCVHLHRHAQQLLKQLREHRTYVPKYIENLIRQCKSLTLNSFENYLEKEV